MIAATELVDATNLLINLANLMLRSILERHDDPLGRGSGLQEMVFYERDFSEGRVWKWFSAVTRI